MITQPRQFYDDNDFEQLDLRSVDFKLLKDYAPVLPVPPHPETDAEAFAAYWREVEELATEVDQTLDPADGVRAQSEEDDRHYEVLKEIAGTAADVPVVGTGAGRGKGGGGGGGNGKKGGGSKGGGSKGGGKGKKGGAAAAAAAAAPAAAPAAPAEEEEEAPPAGDLEMEVETAAAPEDAKPTVTAEAPPAGPDPAVAELAVAAS
jgi:hypothetical protein